MNTRLLIGQNLKHTVKILTTIFVAKIHHSKVVKIKASYKEQKIRKTKGKQGLVVRSIFLRKRTLDYKSATS